MTMPEEIEPTIPNKTKLMFRLMVIAVAVSGLAEVTDIAATHFPSKWEYLFEIAEHVIQICLLFVFMNIFVAKPLLTEIKKRRELEKELRKSEFSNRTILEAMPDNILHISGDGTIIDTKLEHDGVLDFTIGQNITDKINVEFVQVVKENITAALATGQLQRLELTNHDDSEVSHHEFRFAKSGNNEVIVIIRNVTNRKLYEEKLVHVSNHDALTKVYNRTFYESELERLGKSRRYPVGVIIIDLDGLKATNDTYGHAAGDKMIIKAANVLHDAVRADDLIARIGGDEFAILLPETSAEALGDAEQRIMKAVEQSNETGDGFTLKLSLGTALAETKEKLLGSVRLADKNMYHNKASKKPNGA